MLFAFFTLGVVASSGDISIDNWGTTQVGTAYTMGMNYSPHIWDMKLSLPNHVLMVNSVYIQVSNANPLVGTWTIGSSYSATDVPEGIQCSSFETFHGNLNGHGMYYWLKCDFGGQEIVTPPDGTLYSMITISGGSNSRTDTGSSEHTSFYYTWGIPRSGYTSFYFTAVESYNYPGIYFQSLGDGKCVDGEGNFPKRYFNGDTIHVAEETCQGLCQASMDCIGFSHLPLGDKHTCILYVAAGTDFETVPEGFLAMEMEGTATEITTSDGEVLNDDATFTCNKKEIVQCVLPQQQEGLIISEVADLQDCWGTLGYCDHSDYAITGVQCEQYWSQSDEGFQVNQCTTQDPQVSVVGCVKNEWQATEWSDCTANCDTGAGYRIRTVTCSAGVEEECNPAEKPEAVQTCESHLGECEFQGVYSNGGTCRAGDGNADDETCARKCLAVDLMEDEQECENFCRTDPYCRGYNWRSGGAGNHRHCALTTFSDCGKDFSAWHMVNDAGTLQDPGFDRNVEVALGAYGSDSCYTGNKQDWGYCKRKSTTYTKGEANYWDFAATWQEYSPGQGPLEYGPNSALIVTKTTPVDEDNEITYWDPVDNVQGKGGVISTLIARAFFEHAGYSNWDGAIFQVLVNGMEERYVKAYASSDTNTYSMVFQYPTAVENDWTANDVIMSPTLQCRIPDTLPEGYKYSTTASDAFLVDCSTETDGCLTPQFGGLVCDEENGYVLASASIEITQCSYPSTDYVELSGCVQTVCQLPVQQEGYDTSTATLSNCDATENGCDDPIFDGLECAENYATFPDHLGVEQCTVAEPISMLVGCYEVIHQELDATFWTEADAQLLCQNMADELNGYIYECTLSATRRRLAEGFAHTLVVRVGVPHLDTAIDQLSQDDFLEEILPEGMEPHHVNLQEPYQLLMEQPTVAPTQFVLVSQTETTALPIGLSSSTLMPILEDESIAYVAEHDWFSRESIVTVLAAFAVGTCFAVCSIRLCMKTNKFQEKDAPFMDVEAKLSNTESFKRAPSNSFEWLDLGLGPKLNSRTKIWSEVANEHE